MEEEYISEQQETWKSGKLNLQCLIFPCEVPTGTTARVEFNIIPFVKKEENIASTTSPKLRITKKERLAEYLT